MFKKKATATVVLKQLSRYKPSFTPPDVLKYFVLLLFYSVPGCFKAQFQQ